MKKDLLNILACPVCKGRLDLRATREDNDNIIEGALLCEQCSQDYPIEDSIPNLLPPSSST